jgi:hypothetical protein
MAKRKGTNNDVQYTTQKNKDWTTLTPLKPGETQVLLLHMSHPSCYDKPSEKSWMKDSENYTKIKN